MDSSSTRYEHNPLFNMSKELKTEIVKAIWDVVIAFSDENEKLPKTIYLTRDIRCKIEALTRDDIGDLAEEIFREGAPKALKKIFGFTIEGWDSGEIKVE